MIKYNILTLGYLDMFQPIFSINIYKKINKIKKIYKLKLFYRQVKNKILKTLY